MPTKTSPKTQRAGTVALLGRPNVGKSTLLNALCGERIAITSHHPQTTRDRIAGIVTRPGAQLVFLDTPGVHSARHKLGERMNHLATSSAADCDVVIFMTDVAAQPQNKPRPEDVQILRGVPEGKPVVLVINKIDRVKPRELLFPVLEEHAKLRDFAAVVPIGALRGDGAERLIEEVAKLLPEGEAIYGDDEITDKPVRFLVSEYVREQILRRTREEIPHGVAVTIESFEEGAKVHKISATIHVAKDSHKGILIGNGGTMLKEIGMAARKTAERLVGHKIHLTTFVRATPKWFDDPARLAEMGYVDEAPKKQKKTAPKKKKSAKAS